MRAVHAVPDGGDSASDEQLMARLAAGDADALGPLYGRYASRIFGLAAQTLDRAAAEEIVQEVFLAVWRKADTFAPARGPFRPWAMRIAHLRVLNELRRRGRRPQLERDPDGLHLLTLPDPEPLPDEAAWTAQRRDALWRALHDLPSPQRRAVGLALDGLTHEEIATELHLPLGTAKTRIRAALRRLRANLASVAAIALMVGAAALLGGAYVTERTDRERDERALRLVTNSETEMVRLTAAPGTPSNTHAAYRGHTGDPIAVMTFSNFPPTPPGETYRLWARYSGVWTPLAVVQPDTSGSARLILEDPRLAIRPDAIQVTLDRDPTGPAPSGPVVIAWSAN